MPALAIAVAAELRPRFLDGLAPQAIKTVLAAATERRYFTNSVITNHGNPAEHLFLLTKGRARYFYITPDGKKLLLQWLVPGDIFGGMVLVLKHSSYLVSVEAIKDSRVLVWDRAKIRALTLSYPLLLQNTLEIASDYFAWYLADHVALVSLSARKKIANVLICLARVIGEKVPGGLELDITNEELASAANVTPFTASRLLGEWQRSHALVKRRGKILLRSPERLFLNLV
jgi:CRP-like cAMP-binding protein